MGQIGGVYVRDDLMPSIPEDNTRPGLGAIFSAAAQQAYGQVRYGLPLALKAADGSATAADQAFYAKGLADSGVAAQSAAPAAIGDVFSGKVGLGRFIAENLTAGAPMLAGGVAGGVAGGALGGPGGALAGTIAATAPQLVGSNVERAIQSQGGLSGEAATRALIAAPIQAAPEALLGRFLPGAGHVIGDLAAEQTGGFLARTAKSIAKAAGTGAGAMAVQEAGARFAADENLTGADAVQSYINSAATGFAIGGVIGAGGGIKRSNAHNLPAAEVTPDDLSTAVDDALSGRQLPGPEQRLALPAPGQGVDIPAGNDLRRPDFQVDPRGNAAPATPEGTAALTANPVGNFAVDAAGNAIVSPTVADLATRAHLPADTIVPPAAIDAFTARFGRQEAPQLDLPGGRAEEVQPGLPFAQPAGGVETPASQLPQLGLDRNLSELEPETQLGLGERRVDDVTDPNARAFQSDSFNRLKQAIDDKKASPEVKAAAQAEVAHRTLEATGQAPLTGDFQQRLAEVKDGLRSQWVDKLTADNPEQLLLKVHDELFENQNTQANVVKLGQRLGLLDEKLEPTALSEQVEAAKAAGDQADATAAAAEPVKTPVGAAPEEPAVAASPATASSDTTPERASSAALPAAPATVDPTYEAKWNQLKSQVGINRLRSSEALRDTPPNQQAAEATVFRALADDKSNAQTSQVEKMAKAMGLVTDNESMDVTPKGRQAYLATPEGREDIAGAAREQGYEGTSASTFDRGVQAQLGGAEVGAHTSFEDMAAYQAGKVWAEDFVATPGTKTLEQTRAIQGRQDARTTGRAVAREDVARSELTPGQVRQRSLNHLLDNADLRTAKDEDVARLRRMVRDGGTPEEVGQALAAVQGGKTLFREPERAPSRELPGLPTRGQPLFKEMNTADRTTGTKAGTRAESEAAVRTFRLREVIKQALLDGEIKTARAEKLNDLLDEGKVDQVGRVVTEFDANSIGAYVREGDAASSDLDRVLGSPNGRILDGPLRYPPQEFGPLDRRSMARDVPATGIATGRGMNDRELAQYRRARWLEKQGGVAAARAEDRLADNQRSSGASDLAFEQAIAGKSFHEAVDYMVDNAPSPYLGDVMKGVRGLASKLEALGQKLTVNVVGIGDQAPVAMLGQNTRALALHTVEPPVSSIWLKKAELGPAAGTNFQVAAHEMIHAVTMRALNWGRRADQANTNLGRASRDLIALGNRVVQHLNARIAEGVDQLKPIERDLYDRRINALADHNEVLAWGMTNPDFQRYLQGIEYAPRQSVFSKLVDGVRSMLGLDGKYNTALTELMRVSEQINGLNERDLAPVFGRNSAEFGETGPVQAHLSEQGESAANRTVDAANEVTKRVATSVGEIADRVKAADFTGAARRASLGWRSDNSLTRDYAHLLPGMAERSAAKGKHDGIRGTIGALAAQPVQSFQAFEKGAPKMARMLNELMRLTTQFKIDPTKSFDEHTHLHDDPNAQALRGLHAQAADMKNQLSRGDGEGWRLFQDFRAYNEMENHAQLAMNLHTLVAEDPEFSLGVAGSDVNPMDAFTALGAASSDEARTYWKGALNDKLAAVKAFIQQKMGEVQAGSASDIRGMTQHLSNLQEAVNDTGTTLAGMARSPYFHLGRFGDFFGSATIRKLENGQVDPRARDAVADALHKAGIENVYIGTDVTQPKFSARFESKGATEVFKNLMLDLHAKGFLDGEVDAIHYGPRELAANTGVLPALPAYLRAIIAKLDTSPAYAPEEGATPAMKADLEARKQEAITAVRDAYLEQQPDSAIAKVLTRRYERPGFDPDMLRNFSHRASVGATSLANKGTSAELGNAWKTMRTALSESRSAGNDADPYLRSDLVNELQKRDAVQPVAPSQGTFINKLNAVAHPYYLGLSPSYVMVTQAQVGMNALPELAKVHGYVSSFHALRRAFPVALSLMRSAMAEAAKGGAAHYADLALTEAALQGSKMSKPQIDFVRRMVATGSLDIGQVANAMHQIAKTGGSSPGEIAMKYASGMALHAETYSRLIVALAAHELHGGEDIDARTAYARNVVSESMFDFQSWNKARLLGKQGFLGPLTPLVTQFMTFSTQMTEKLYSEVISATGKVRPGETAEAAAERARQARVFLAGHLVATTALAGTLGLPFASVFAAAASKIGNIGRGQDEEQFDATNSYRNFLAHVLGKDVAEVVSHGAPRALGADLSGRVGEADLLPFSKLLGDKRSWRESVQNAMGRSGGAALSMLENLADAGTHFGNGDVLGGMVAGLPTSLKNPAKAYQMSTEGYVDSKGKVLPMTPDARDVLFQLLGFQPSDKAEYQEARTAQSDRRMELSGRANTLRGQIVKALTTGDTARAQELVGHAQEFDRANPAFAVIPSLAGAVERQAQSRAQARALGTPLGVPVQDVAARHLTAYANF
jgi:hypothetical protein